MGKFVTVGKDGSIELPEDIKKLFPMYVSLSIRDGVIVLRPPTSEDKWTDDCK